MTKIEWNVKNTWTGSNPTVLNIIYWAKSIQFPNGHPLTNSLLYQLLNSVDWQNLIHEAHRHIESETCIRFIENGTDRDYLLYTRGSGCWSNVGRVGGRQQISIGYGCDAASNNS